MLDPDIEYDVHVDGEPIDMDEFTFEEADEYRALVRESAGDADLVPRFAEAIDKWPAMVTIVRRRTNPDFTLADAKTLKTSDILQPKEKARPTKAAKKA